MSSSQSIGSPPSLPLPCWRGHQGVSQVELLPIVEVVESGVDLTLPIRDAIDGVGADDAPVVIELCKYLTLPHSWEGGVWLAVRLPRTARNRRSPGPRAQH